MKKAILITIIVIAALALASGAVYAGTLLGARYASTTASQPLTTNNDQDTQPYYGDRGFGPGMMNGNRGYGPGMMDGQHGYGPGMMNGNQGYGPGMMYGYGNTNLNVTPLTIDQAYNAAQDYLTALNLSDLKIAEVMVFSNNAYVRVVEQSTGMGAFELLVNPVNQTVTPEPGANMMWNLKYGTLMHQEMMGGRMGFNYNGTQTIPTVDSSMAISPEQAVQAAQTWIDANLAGDTASATPDAFYGYYTVEILKDGQTVGMLSVNGTSGEVFYHTWHGSFIEGKEY